MNRDDLPMTPLGRVRQALADSNMYGDYVERVMDAIKAYGQSEYERGVSAGVETGTRIADNDTPFYIHTDPQK